MPKGTNVGSVWFNITSNRGAFTKEMKKTASGVQSTWNAASSKVKTAIGTAFSVSAVVSFGKKCVQVASETQSAWMGLNSILNGQGKSFNQANKFIQQYISDGLVPLNNAVTAYKNLAARGYSTEQIEKTLTALKDAAAFGRQASYSYGEAIQTATEGLKNENSILVDNAGVTKNVAKMWDDYAKSIGTTSNKLTQQQKIQAEVAGILNETKWQTGDAAKYSDTFAGRIAKLSATFTSLKTTLGNVIIPILNLFLPAIQTAMDALSRFLATLQSVMSSLGLEMPDISSLSSVTSNAIDAATAISSTGTAAETAAKKAKKAFASFDEINVLNTSTAAAESSGSALSIDTSALSPTVGEIDTKINIDTAGAEKTLSKIKPVIDKVKEKLDMLRKIDFKPLKTSFGDLWSSLKNYGDDVFETLEWAYDEILVPLATWTIEDVAPAAVKALSGAYKVLSVVLTELLNPALNWLWNNALQPIIALVKDGLILVLELLAELLYDIADWIPDTAADFKEAWSSIKENAVLAWKGIKEAWTVVSTWFDEKIIQPVARFFTDLWSGISLAANHCWTTVKDCWNSVATWFNEKIIQPVAKFFANLWSNLGTAASNAWQTLRNAFSSAGVWFKDNVTQPIAKFFSDVWSNLSTAASNAWQSVKNAFKSVGTFFGDMWSKTIKPKFTEIGSKIGKAVGDAFKTAINGALKIIEGILNAPIKAINGLLDVINKVPGVSISKISEISLPRLAQGGWVAANNPQLAIVGDNRREGEIIAPESKIREAVEEALRKVGSSSAVQTVKLALELIIRYPDGRTIIKQINEVQIAEGRILLEV